MNPRRSDWMQTYTGRQFWPLSPHPSEVDIRDIAHALGNLCRFTGHCTDFYSVAQHSVLVSDLLPDDLKLWGLLHDASEAYLVDVPRPIKPHLTNYREIEDRVTAAIAAKFKLPMPMPPEVKWADEMALATEARQLMSRPPAPWRLSVDPLDLEIIPILPREASDLFMFRFLRLTERPAAAVANESDAD